jgi:hypothetical protein
MNVEALNKSFKAAARAQANRRRLPNSIEEADLVQEAWLVALEKGHKYVDDGRATLATFLKMPLTWRFAECIAASHYGPSTSVRHWRRKKGLPVNYGEVSHELLGALDGVPWIETIAADDTESVHFTISPAERFRHFIRHVTRQAPRSSRGLWTAAVRRAVRRVGSRSGAQSRIPSRLPRSGH